MFSQLVPWSFALGGLLSIGVILTMLLRPDIFMSESAGGNALSLTFPAPKILGGGVRSTAPSAAAASQASSTSATSSTVSLTIAHAVIAFAFLGMVGAFVLPISVLYMNSKVDDIPVRLRVPLVPATTDQKFSVLRKSESGDYLDVNLTVFKSSESQVYAISTASYLPVTVATTYEWADRALKVTVDGAKTPEIVQVNGMQGTLEPITLTPAQSKATTAISHAQPTTVSNVPDKYADVQDPKVTP